MDKFGNEILIVNSQPAKAASFEDTLHPEAAVKATYTDWELKQMKKRIQLTGATE